MSVLKILTYIIIGITARTIVLAAILEIMSVSYIYIYTLYLHPIYVMGISGDILKCIAVISLSHQLPSNIILHQVRLGNPLNMTSFDGIKK
jgi:hypothetical protein